MEVKKKPRQRQTVYKDPKDYNFHCYCGKAYNLRKQFNWHKKKVHGEIPSQPDNTFSKYSKTCSLCHFAAKFRDEMIRHFEAVHGATFTRENLVFPSEEDFFNWKTKVEEDTSSRFIKTDGTRIYTKHKTTNYECHRSGYYSSKGKGIRILKIQGSVKINGFCPARIRRQLNDDGSCNVTYFATHIGHEKESTLLALSSSDEVNQIRKFSKVIRSRHRIMEAMAHSIIIPSDDGWEIMTEECEEIYHVQRQPANCENCQLICNRCGICLHQFQCTCSDYSVKCNMCKHIHLVAKSMKNTQIPTNIGLNVVNGNPDIHEQNTENCVSETQETNPENLNTNIPQDKRNCSIIDEPSKRKSRNFDLPKLKEKLQASFIEILDSLSTIEEYEVLTNTLAPLDPKLKIIFNQFQRDNKK